MRAIVGAAALVACTGGDGTGWHTPAATPPVVTTGAAPAPTPIAPGAPLRLGTSYDAAIATPDDCLGFPIGDRPAAGEQIIACFRTWAAQSSRLTVAPYVTTFEGRELVRVVISSPANLAKLDAILADLGTLADPRKPGATGAVDRIAHDGPAVAWFGYSIHGDEMSGADASLVFGYHLIAGSDAEVGDLLDHLVVVIDPVMNPDGRNRILTQLAQARSVVPNLDDASGQRGWWPYGRGNHYLFDLNRDWFAGVMPETQGRWRELAKFRPQLVVDVHEMGSQDTYLFYPRSEPVEPAFPSTGKRWHDVFAQDQAAAFDANGWAYYTREWADGWYPGYSDAWSELRGAVGILYEQAGTGGLALKRESGEVATYRDSVARQAVSSLANLRTLARNREALLRDFAAYHRAYLGDGRVVAIATGRAPDRERLLARTLIAQGIEVYTASAAFTGRGSAGADEPLRTHDFPAGTLIVPLGQPLGGLVRAVLELDPHMTPAFLTYEREQLEHKNQSRIYDITAWNLGMAFGLDTWWLDGTSVARTALTTADEPAPGIAVAAGDHAAVAWIVDGRLDGSVAFAAAALARGLDVHVADEPLTVAGVELARGSVVIRRDGNPADVEAQVAEAARTAGVVAHAASTGRSADEHPDLGGHHLTRLVRPRVAVLTNAPISTADFGHVWYQLDRELHVSVTLIETSALGDHDLRRYNVIVIPAASGELAPILADNKDALAAWVKGGGTLIALGSSAMQVADEKLGLTAVRGRSAVLDTLDLYDKAAKREIDSRTIKVDPAQVWGPPPPTPVKPTKPAPGSGSGDAGGGGGSGGGGGGGGDKKALEAEDAWQLRFAPHGVLMRGLVDGDAWLTYGAPAELPVIVDDAPLVARAPVRTAIRIAPVATLRMSGLVWPEARKLWAETAWATVESVGNGQVILFASPPSLRLIFRGTARLFANAVVFGPGLGASQPLAW